MKQDLNCRLVCPDCRQNPPRLLEDFRAGYFLCKDCGNILGDRIIDTSSEWRSFDTNSSHDPSRTGEASNLFDADPTALQTLIAGKTPGQGVDLGKTHVRISGRVGGHMNDIMREITVLAERINLPKRLCEDAKHLYRKAEEERLIKGKPREAIVGACLYAACRQEKETTRTFKEICSLARIKKKDLNACYQEIKKIAKIQAPTENENYIHRFCSNLNLPQNIANMVQKLCKQISDLELVRGKNPLSIAAACIYMVTATIPDHYKGYKEISAVTGMSEMTIRGTYRKLLEHYEALRKKADSERASLY